MAISETTEQKNEIYITNKHGHYFTVRDKVELSRLDGCKVHATKRKMYLHVCKVHDLQLDEVESLDYLIESGCLICDRGFSEPIEGTTEDFLNNFDL